jgi:hypothetical protein
MSRNRAAAVTGAFFTEKVVLARLKRCGPIPASMMPDPVDGMEVVATLILPTIDG